MTHEQRLHYGNPGTFCLKASVSFVGRQHMVDGWVVFWDRLFQDRVPHFSLNPSPFAALHPVPVTANASLLEWLHSTRCSPFCTFLDHTATFTSFAKQKVSCSDLVVEAVLTRGYTMDEQLRNPIGVTTIAPQPVPKLGRVFANNLCHPCLIFCGSAMLASSLHWGYVISIN